MYSFIAFFTFEKKRTNLNLEPVFCFMLTKVKKLDKYFYHRIFLNICANATSTPRCSSFYPGVDRHLQENVLHYIKRASLTTTEPNH